MANEYENLRDDSLADEAKRVLAERDRLLELSNILKEQRDMWRQRAQVAESFHDAIAPDLDDLLQGMEEYCNSEERGGAARYDHPNISEMGRAAEDEAGPLLPETVIDYFPAPWTMEENYVHASMESVAMHDEVLGYYMDEESFQSQDLEEFMPIASIRWLGYVNLVEKRVLFGGAVLYKAVLTIRSMVERGYPRPQVLAYVERVLHDIFNSEIAYRPELDVRNHNPRHD
jgi:hypothetical protein